MYKTNYKIDHNLNHLNVSKHIKSRNSFTRNNSNPTLNPKIRYNSVSPGMIKNYYG